MSITIYDLAKKLNYSPSTISRALNNHKSIGKKTTLNIQKAAKEMGYKPNTQAASLRSKQSKTIGILISRINRPFVSTLISGIEDAARKSGYNVLISQSNDHYKDEITNANTLLQSRVSGLIVSLSMETKNTDHFKEFTDQGIPVVFVDRVPLSFNSYKVIIDNYNSAFQATQHLIEQGCKRIAHFAGSQHLNVYNQRRSGYLDALKHHNIPIDKELIINLKSLSFEEGKIATEKLLKLPLPPDGIFSANDTAALSAITYLKEQQIRIPEDIAIIGFNDDPIASIIEPSLSTVSHPAYKMGELSFQRILEHTTDRTIAGVSEIFVLDTSIIIRKSSKRY
ncbi:LacI family transcriptional regulator [Neptunitalea chrysea]|uniref:LacI family transcriptional regulator n=1 Tax=Neptunitalea chrysea TaxID=1647581 RepID=A0A9W6ETY3_9FLAO|nr:LacI family DNA-binding transcriptional regulator [Neptunitalea chrysea]GLB51874.1 LacI family transcriptional regulator [Neptunitalea chrysea]